MDMRPLAVACRAATKVVPVVKDKGTKVFSTEVRQLKAKVALPLIHEVVEALKADHVTRLELAIENLYDAAVLNRVPMVFIPRGHVDKAQRARLLALWGTLKDGKDKKVNLQVWTPKKG